MNILITGAKGFVGRNLSENLKNIRDGKNRIYPGLSIEGVYEYDIDTDPGLLDEFCSKADFVFNLAGVNRPVDESDFMKGNFGFASTLLETLKRFGNKCPVMLSSSIQACCSGRYAGSEYGKSKQAGEELFFRYEEETGAEVYVYRFPNLFGKWCRPNYNSVVATFCNNIANDMPIRIDNRDTELELLYIDDLVEGMISLLLGNAVRCRYEDAVPVISEEGRFCVVPVTHRVTLGEISDMLYDFHEQPDTLMMPELADGSFSKKQ